MHKVRKNRRNKRLCKGMALLLIAALLLSQSSLSMQAEESREEAGAETVTVTDEEAENSGVDEGVDADTDTDIEIVPGSPTGEETAGADAGEETGDPDVSEDENIGADIDADTGSVSDVDMDTSVEENILPLADETENAGGEDVVSPAAEWFDFIDKNYKFKFMSGGNLEVEVTGHEDGTSVSGDLVIPSKASSNGVTEFAVVRIGLQAFLDCNNIKSVTIPYGVTWIEFSAFSGCSNLTSITIPDSVTYISSSVFHKCSSLKSITIPDDVTVIGAGAFNECSSLESVRIPAGVARIEQGTFRDCSGLKSVTILNDKIYIVKEAFWNCEKLNSLQIALPENITGTPTIENGNDCFRGCPGDRSLTFLTKDGTKLSDTTTPTLAEAMSKYDAADGIDDDGMWYGWKLTDDSATPDTGHVVTIKANKDGSEWNDSGRTFALSSDNGSPLITDLSNVSNGTYTIYDITDRANYVNTKVSVTVDGADVGAVVNYHTVTFYNGASVFREEFVPDNTTVKMPLDTPTKEGQSFKQWATSEDGSTAFDFTAPITAKTNIHASWILKDEDYFTITASAGEGGSVDPSGKVPVRSGEGRRFTITPGDGYRISSVLVDGTEELNKVQTADYLRAGLTDGENNVKYYEFENVTSDHTLEVSFETTQTGGSDTGDEGDPGNTGDDSGSGNSGNDGSGGGNGGSGGNSGDSGSGSSGGGSTDGSSGSGEFGGGDGSSTSGSGSNSSVISSDISAASGAGIVQTGGAAPASGGNKEPKTGDAFHVEVYASLAMIVGLFYLLLYFADGVGGMTEEEKRELIAKLIRWAEKGKPFRKYVALAGIFMILVYYHAVGKRTLLCTV